MGGDGETTFRARLARLTGDAAVPHAAVVDDAGTWSWSDIGRVRRGLDAVLQVGGPHPCVGVVLGQDAATVGSLLAVLATGRCALLLSPLASDRELADELVGLPGLPVVARPRDWGRPAVLDAALAAGLTAISVDGDQEIEVRARGRDGAPGSSPGPDDAVIVRTSGTTGAPQRVAVTWDRLDAVGQRVTPAEPGSGNGITINVIPMYSIGAVVGLAGSVWRGRPTAILERFEPRRWAELVRDHRPRQVGIPPAGFRALLEADVPAAWLGSVRGVITGSAPMDVEAVRGFVRRYEGIAVINQYGSTEFGGPVLSFDRDDWPEFGSTKLGSVGRPLPGVQARLVDPDSQEPTASAGLLQIDQGRGWVQTTDLAEVDDEGFFWIRGRADDVIVRGGFKVPPHDVEQVLARHPAVEEAVVVGLPDARLGQVPGAAVTVRSGGAVTPDELSAFAREQLTAYMVPAVIRIVEEIPRNEMLKPLRREVVALLTEDVGAR